MRRLVIALLAVILGSALGLRAEFENRYPKLDGFAHHIYIEGYDLPVLNAGPSDPAVHPDGRSVFVAARGWLWRLDLASRVATRLTRGRELDSRPAVSPDGRRMAFVRDDGRDMRIMVKDLGTGSESLLADSKALDLDPVFSGDGRTLYWSSGEAGDMDVWSLDLETLGRARVTTDLGNEWSPRPLPGRELLFVAKKRGMADALTLLNLDTGTRRVLREDWIASNLRPAVSPDGRLVAATFPAGPLARLLLLDRLALPEVELRGGGLPLMPAFAPDGDGIFFVEADRTQRFRLMRMARSGGEAEDVSPIAWDFLAPTARLSVNTRRAGRPEPLPARLSVVDASGHPAVPDQGVPRFDSQNGIVYFFSDGAATVEVPVGEAKVSAVHGLATPLASRTVAVGEGGAEVVLDLEPVWNAQTEGFFSGDHHWHRPDRMPPAVIRCGRKEAVGRVPDPVSMYQSIPTPSGTTPLGTQTNSHPLPPIGSQEARLATSSSISSHVRSRPSHFRRSVLLSNH